MLAELVADVGSVLHGAAAGVNEKEHMVSAAEGGVLIFCFIRRTLNISTNFFFTGAIGLTMAGYL